MTRNVMTTWKLMTAVALGVGLSWLAITPAYVQTPRVLTDQDRADIQQLLVRYARALSTCASKEYADLFTPDGVFTSDDFRSAKHREMYGKSATLVGREKLIELVETEPYCMDAETRAKRASSPPNPNAAPPTVVIEPTAEGAKGTAPIGRGGRYEDVYVKTASGWRFKSRTVFMPPLAASQPATPPAQSR
jgi:hypothetical protein